MTCVAADVVPTPLNQAAAEAGEVASLEIRAAAVGIHFDISLINND